MAKKRAMQQLSSFVAGRGRLYVGLLASHTAEALELAKFGERLGFEGALLPPHLYGDEPVAVVAEFLARSSARYLLYNPPGAAPLGQVVRSLVDERILGLKDSSGDLTLLAELLAPPRPCPIYYGREHLLDKALELEIDGIVPGTGNVAPALVMQLWRQRDSASWEAFAAFRERLRSLAPESYIQGLKRALVEAGIIRG